MLSRLLFILVFFSCSAFALDKPGNVIPYLVYKYIPFDQIDPNNLPEGAIFQTEGLMAPTGERFLSGNAPVQISKVGAVLCQNMDNATIKVWFSITDAGELSIANISEQTGIEVEYHCGK